MACASQSMISANSCAFPFQRTLKRIQRKERSNLFSVRASSEESDCNEEECAPDKEVGKVSMEWIAVEKTKVVGTYPPRRKGWTGYVEKDTAGQTNIYSVEPAVYVAESAISSGSAGTSADGAEKTAAVAAGLGLISIAAASAILLQVGKNTSPVQVQTLEYSGPSLSYYINKFKPIGRIEASVPSEPQDSIPSKTTPGVPQVSVESQSQAEIVDLNVSNSS